MNNDLNMDGQNQTQSGIIAPTIVTNAKNIDMPSIDKDQLN